MMFFKVSNTAEREEIVEKLGIDFKYPHLYKPKMVINGLGEDNLSIITNEDPDEFQIAIWGVMPPRYKDQWSTFQNMVNTLNLSHETISETPWLKKLLKKNRCLILATGFFSYFMKGHEIYPYHIYLKTGEPFFLAGIYSELQDGFLSCSIISTKIAKPVSKFHNLSNEMPLAIPESIAGEWISKDYDIDDILNIIKNPPQMEFRANPIAKEFFKNNIVYDTILQPVYYDSVMEDE